jgi:hypothetical protein
VSSAGASRGCLSQLSGASRGRASWVAGASGLRGLSAAYTFSRRSSCGGSLSKRLTLFAGCLVEDC